MTMARRPELTSIEGKAADFEEVAEAAEEEAEVEWEAVLEPVADDAAEETSDLKSECINEECEVVMQGDLLDTGGSTGGCLCSGRRSLGHATDGTGDGGDGRRGNTGAGGHHRSR